MIQNGKQKWYKKANKNDTEWQNKSDTELQTKVIQNGKIKVIQSGNIKVIHLTIFYIQKRQKCRFEGEGLPNFIQELAVALA